MEPLNIEETVDTPLITLDSEKGIYKISGRSLPEDAVHFYAPVKNWLIEYCANPNPVTEFNFEMDYYNSASTKQFVIILTIMEEILIARKKVKVIWHYNKEDEVMLDKGEEIKTMVSIPFELRTF